MTEHDSSHQQITCNHCGTEFVAAFADAPVCPNCNAIHVGSAKKTKRKNETEQAFSALAPQGFTITSVPEGVQISWRPGSRYVLIAFILFLSVPVYIFGGGLLTDGLDAVWIIIAIIIITPLLIGTLVALRNVINRKIITITDTAILDDIQPFTYPDHKKTYPLHIIKEVFVRENRDRSLTMNNRMSYGYDIILATDDGEDITIAELYDRHFAAIVAHRIKSIAHIRPQETLAPSAALPAKQRTKRPVNPPSDLEWHEDDKTLSLSWQVKGTVTEQIAVILLSLAATGFVSIFTVIPYTITERDAVPLLSLLVGTAVLAGIGYLLHNAKPTMTLTVDIENIIIRRTSADVPSIKLPSDQVEQLFVTRKMSTIGSGRNRKILYRYYLNVLISDDPYPVQCADFASVMHALYAEQQIERFLGIQDLPAAGEYNTFTA